MNWICFDLNLILYITSDHFFSCYSLYKMHGKLHVEHQVRPQLQFQREHTCQEVPQHWKVLARDPLRYKLREQYKPLQVLRGIHGLYLITLIHLQCPEVELLMVKAKVHGLKVVVQAILKVARQWLMYVINLSHFSIIIFII